MSGAYRTRHSGVIDADGHVLEPMDLWEDYLEARYRKRALRLRRDDDGLEYLEIDGRPSQFVTRGYPGTMAGMGRTRAADFRPTPERTYLAAARAFSGAMDREERLQLVDAEGLSAVLLYPTIAITWEAELSDPELSQAYCRAYNRWVADFCRDSGGRLVAVAQLSLTDPEAAALELERAVADGCRGAFVASFTATRVPHGHEAHDRVFAVAQSLDVPLAIHPTVEPADLGSRRFAPEHRRRLRLLGFTGGADGVRHAFTTFFDCGTFDRFPRLRLVLLESGGGWIGYWLDRLDAVYASTFVGDTLALEDKPSSYFRRQCAISCDPDERTIPSLMELLGPQSFFWASDYPHPDHTPDYLRELDSLADVLPAEARAQLLGANVRRAYSLT